MFILRYTYRMEHIVGLRKFREDIGAIEAGIAAGRSFVVVRRSKPIFKVSGLDGNDERLWETVADFTKVRRGGVCIKDLLSRL